jgi:hypothetical protein
MLRRMIPENWKNLADAMAITIMTMLGLDKIVLDNIDVLPFHPIFMTSTTHWTDISMKYFLWGSAVCTFVWLFFRAVDVVVAKVQQVKKWYKELMNEDEEPF